MDRKPPEKTSKDQSKSPNPLVIDANTISPINQYPIKPMNMYAPPPPSSIPISPGYPYYAPPWGNIPLPQSMPLANSTALAQPANSKAANAPWHKPGPITTQPPITVFRPTNSTVETKVNINITKTAPLAKVQKKTAPIAVSTFPSTGTPKVPNVSPREEWSSNVKIYVERAFLSCKTPAQRDAMEQLLRLKIKEAISSERMSKINWEVEPIPLLPGSQVVAATSMVPPIKLVKAKASSPVKAVMTADDKKNSERAKRFESDKQAFQRQQEQNQLALQNVRIEDNQGDVIDWDEYTIVGTCQKLEKPYLRLTSAPDPATVRPLPVLRAALKMLKDKWRSGSDYGYICDQFKSLRQDMTVQRIKSDFTVQVYEIHARIAIETGDLGQYNQCQTQLKDLYAIGLFGSEFEFSAYRLLYLIHCRNKQAINHFMSDLNDKQRENAAVSHALKVHSAVAIGNYSHLFRLYNEAPNMGAYLIDLFVPRERYSALLTILKAYRPTISISFITKTLAFSSEDECKTWLSNELDGFNALDKVLDCKAILSSQT